MQVPKIKVIFKCLGHNISSYSVLFLSLRTIFLCVCIYRFVYGCSTQSCTL